jgi:hypothetical protein
MGISRAVDHTLQDAGYAPRLGFPPIAEQLAQAAGLSREVVLADDVLFSGEMVSSLAEALATRGTQVKEVICGIAIAEGAEKLEAEGIAVTAVRTYADVEDELCERDFALVPGSGRRLIEREQHALYFDNLFGRPRVWASIPLAHEHTFCLNSLRRNIPLLRAGTPMEALGSFVGYPSTGPSAAAILQQVLTERTK